MLGRRDIVRGAAGLAGLVAAPARADGALASGVAGHVAATLDELRAAPASSRLISYKGATYAWLSGDFSKPPLGPPDDIFVVKQDRAPLSTGAWVRLSSTLSVTMFGAIEGRSANSAANTQAFRRAVETAAALGLPLDLNGGFFELDADRTPSGGINFGRAGLHIQGRGATLHFNGSGRAFILDAGGADGAFLEGLSVEDLTIVGGLEVTDGFYARGVVRSVIRNVAVLDVGGKAFHIKHGVSCQYDSLKYSASPAGQPTPKIFASHGLYIDSNGAGYYSANCTFINPVMEGFPGVGCEIEDGAGNLFVGGTFEACQIGLVIGSRAHSNEFVKPWLEANSTADAIIAGSNNGFLGGRFMSFAFSGPNVRIAAESRGSWFSGGGYIRYVHMDRGSTETSFHQIGVDENRSGTIGFQGSGSYTRIGCKKIGPDNEVVGLYEDILGPVEALGAEGRWSPVLRTTRGAIVQDGTYTHGHYQKIGAMVFAQCQIAIGGVRSPGGEVTIEGLPFTAAFRHAGSVHATGLASASEPIQALVEAGGRDLSLSKLSANGPVDIAADLRVGTTLTITVAYTARTRRS